MMPLRAVVFDLDDTLLLDEELTRAAFFAAAGVAAARFPGLEPEDFARCALRSAEELFASHPRGAEWNALGIAASELLWADFAESELSAWASEFRRQTFARALAAGGWPGDGKEEARAFASARRKPEALMPGAREVLENLKPNYRLGLLTNGDPGVQHGKLDRSGLGPFFDAVVVSGEHGVGKPNPEIFRKLLAQLGVAPGEAAMVGNSLARDIVGAQAAGLALSVWLKIPGAEEFANVQPGVILTRLEDLPAALEEATGQKISPTL